MPPRKNAKRTARKHVVLRLHKGWTYNSRRRCFTNKDGDIYVPGKELPKYTRIVFQVPSMAKKAKRSKAEDELARGIQVSPPSGVAMSKLLKSIQTWPCVENAWNAPEVHPAESKKNIHTKANARTDNLSLSVPPPR